jgi:hypothetical protein
MHRSKSSLLRLILLPLGLVALLPGARAQLMIQGNVESEITSLSAAGGATAVAKYALAPPGYTTTGSINHTGTAVWTSAYTLQARKGTGSATLLYKPSSGTVNPTNAFAGIESGDTLSLGSLKLTDTSLPSNGSVNFLWTVEFAKLRVYRGATPVTAWFSDVPILSVPLKLTLQHTGNLATLSLAAPYNPATMFNSLVPLSHGYQLALSPAVTLTTLVNELSTGLFKATPTSAHTFGTVDVAARLISPVPEASTYGLCAAGLLAGMVLVQRLRRRVAPVTA